METGEAGNYQPLGVVEREARGADAAAGAWRFRADDGTRVELDVLASDLVRVRLLPPGHEPAHSWSVARTEWPAVGVEVRERDGGLSLATSALIVDVTTQPFRVAFQWLDGEPFGEDDPALGMGRAGAAVRCHKRLPAGERVLGAGERTDALDKRGRILSFFNADPQAPQGDDSDNMHLNIPFWLGMRAGRAYGLFMDSAWQGTLDAGATHPERLTFGAAGGALTYYVFGGPTPAEVLARYADLTGHMPLPPLWSLGYQQSRWSYVPAAQLRAVADELRARAIPCDVLYLDIDYMDGYRDFTWNPQHYPNPAGLLRELREQGFRVVTIIDPGIKLDPTDATFAEGLARDYFCRLPDGQLFTGSVWPGECVFPDFSRAEVRAWWGERHRGLLDAGVAGIWDDMNEPALTTFLTPGLPLGHQTLDDSVRHLAGGEDGPPLAHAAFHNAYGLQMARATRAGLERLRPGERAFVLTRSGTAGVQRYAAVWTGDNMSIWPHVRLALRMCLSLGLSGVAHVGADVGGFWGDASGELLTRFTQLGALLPFFRNHSALHTRAQEPWAFGQPYEGFCRAAIELRYRLLPYLYTAFARAATEGAPIARALAYAFPEDELAAAVDDEFLAGEALLVAPVVEEGHGSRAVYFPAGTWADYWTGQRYYGPVRAEVDAPLDVLPLFAREGAIVPRGPVMLHTGERPWDPITLACYLGAAGSQAEGELYQDDGSTTAYRAGEARRTRFSAAHLPGRVEVRAEAPSGAYDPGAHGWIVELHLPSPAPRTHWRVLGATLDGGVLPAAAGAEAGEGDGAAPGWSVAPRRYETVVRAALGRVAAPFTLVVEVEA